MKNLLLSLFAVFAVASAFGQEVLAQDQEQTLGQENLEQETVGQEPAVGQEVLEPNHVASVFEPTVFLEPISNVEQTLTSVPTTSLEPISAPGLKRTGFTKFAIDGREFSFRDANKFIGDAETMARLRMGIRLEKAAIGLGVVGAVSVCAGLTFIIMDSTPREREATPPPAHGDGVPLPQPEYEEWGGIITFLIGLPLTCGGAALGLAALGMGIGGKAIVKKAIRGYNSDLQSEMQLGMAITPGGLGMQLTF